MLIARAQTEYLVVVWYAGAADAPLNWGTFTDRDRAEQIILKLADRDDVLAACIATISNCELS